MIANPQIANQQLQSQAEIEAKIAETQKLIQSHQKKHDAVLVIRGKLQAFTRESYGFRDRNGPYNFPMIGRLVDTEIERLTQDHAYERSTEQQGIIPVLETKLSFLQAALQALKAG